MYNAGEDSKNQKKKKMKSTKNINFFFFLAEYTYFDLICD